MANQLIKKISLFLTFAFVLSMISGISYQYYETTKLAQNLSNSLKRQLILESFREPMLILNTYINSQRPKIDIYNFKEKRTDFELVHKNDNWFLLKVSHGIYFGDNKESPHKFLNIYYNPIPILTTTLFTWVFFLTSLLLFKKVITQKFNSFILSEVSRQKNLDIGLISRQLAHDIKSPLMALELAIKTKDESDKEELILNSIHRIQSISSDLLSYEPHEKEHTDNITQTDTMSTKNSVEVITIDQNLKALLQSKKLEFQNKNIQFNYYNNINNSNNLISIDVQQLLRIISNIINNSCEAIGSAKGFITVEMNELEDIIEITNRDNGCGIKKENLEQIFNQGFSTKSTNGLGLFHAKKYLEKVSGKITVSSEQNRGATFKITLPVKQGVS